MFLLFLFHCIPLSNHESKMKCGSSVALFLYCKQQQMGRSLGMRL